MPLCLSSRIRVNHDETYKGVAENESGGWMSASCLAVVSIFELAVDAASVAAAAATAARAAVMTVDAVAIVAVATVAVAIVAAAVAAATRCAAPGCSAGMANEGGPSQWKEDIAEPRCRIAHQTSSYGSSRR